MLLNCDISYQLIATCSPDIHSLRGHDRKVDSNSINGAYVGYSGDDRMLLKILDDI